MHRSWCRHKCSKNFARTAEIGHLTSLLWECLNEAWTNINIIDLCLNQRKRKAHTWLMSLLNPFTNIGYVASSVCLNNAVILFIHFIGQLLFNVPLIFIELVWKKQRLRYEIDPVERTNYNADKLECVPVEILVAVQGILQNKLTLVICN